MKLYDDYLNPVILTEEQMPELIDELRNMINSDRKKEALDYMVKLTQYMSSTTEANDFCVNAYTHIMKHDDLMIGILEAIGYTKEEILNSVKELEEIVAKNKEKK